MPSEDPKDLSPVQQLLRLKRHETPKEGFVEDFLQAFKERQRSEMLKQTAHGLLWERWTTYWDNRLSPKWALAGAAAVLLLGVAWVQLPAKSNTASVAVKESEVKIEETVSGSLDDFPVDMVMIMGRDAEETVEEVPQLLSRHFSGGYADDARQVKKTQAAVSSDLLIQPEP
jgi:hypothetical protein